MLKVSKRNFYQCRRRNRFSHPSFTTLTHFTPSQSPHKLLISFQKVICKSLLYFLLYNIKITRLKITRHFNHILNSSLNRDYQAVVSSFECLRNCLNTNYLIIANIIMRKCWFFGFLYGGKMIEFQSNCLKNSLKIVCSH